MSGASAAAVSVSAVTTMWPMMLDLSKDDCRRALRSIELQAYAGVVSAFRAQGDLNKDKKKTLQELQRQLSISTERHRAEVRRAVNDEKLTTIADHVSGPSVTCDWLIEGRRLVPLMPRLVPQTAFTVSANQSSSQQMEKNAQMPSPGLTVTHSIGSCVVKDDDDLLPVPVAAASSDRRWQTQPLGSTAVHHGSSTLSAGGASDGTDRATSGGCSTASVVTVGSSSSSVLSKAPVVTTKVVAPAGVQTPMKVTVTKPQMAAGSTQKLILVNASHSHATASPGAGSNSSSAKSLTSQAVMLTKPAGTAGSAAGSQPKTSVVYPASQALSPGSAGIVVGTSPGASATGSQLQHSLTIARPRPKAIAGPAGASASAGSVIVQQQQVSVTATSAASRLRMPGPSSASPTIATSVVQAKVTSGGAGTALVTAGPQPVSPAAGTRPSVVTSAIAITTKPGIQIKQEGAMKIITSSSTSKQLLPKAAGNQTPIVVVTSTAASAASTAAATGTTGVTVGPTVVRSITTGGQVHVTASGKVIGVTTTGKAAPVGGGSSAAAQSAAASAVAAAASGATAAATSSLVGVSGKPGASIIAHQGTAVTTAAASTAAKAPATPALTMPRTAVAAVATPSAVKSCTVIVQNPPQRQPTASAPAVGGNASTTAPSAAVLATSAVQSRLQRGGGEAACSAAAAQLTQGAAESEQQAVVGSAAAAAGTTATATVILTSGRSSAGEASAARSVAAAAGGVVPPTAPPVELSLMARPSILAGLMQSDTSATLVAAPASSTHIILDHVSAASDGLSTTGAVATGDEVWLLTSDGSGVAEQASAAAAAAASQAVAEVVVEDSASSLCHSDVPVSVAEHVTVSSSSSVEVSGGGQSDEPVGSQAPQFDIFSSALAEAQIDLDPYEYSDEVSTSGGADDTSVAWTTTAAEPQLITVVDALTSLETGGGSTASCIVSDGSSSLLSGTDACVTVAEYQEVSEEFVQAISQCGAIAGDGVSLAVIEGGAAAAAAAAGASASVLADDTAVLASVCLAAPADTASDFAAATAAHSMEPVVVQLGDGVETGVVPSVAGDADSAASSCSKLLTPGLAASRQPEVVVVVSGALGQAADSAADVQMLAASSLPAGDDLVSEDGIANTTSLLPPLHAVSATTEQVTITHLPEVAALSHQSTASVPSPSPDQTSPVSGISSDGGDASASSAAVVRLASVSSMAAGQATGDAIAGSVLTPPTPVVGGVAAETAATVGGIVGLGSSGGIADLAYGVAQRKRKILDGMTAWDDGSLGSWTKAALSLMHKVMKFRGANRSKGEHNASAWFLRPVSDDEAPGYSAVVHTPMDFGTIKRKLEAGTYAAASAVGIDEFHADVTLVRANCSLYNPPEHCVRRDCDEVMAYYEREFERTFGRLPPPSRVDVVGSGNANSRSSAGLTEAGDEVSAASPKRCKMSDDSNSSGTAT